MKGQYARELERIRVGVGVDCISFDYTSSTMLPSEMRTRRGDGILPSIQGGIRPLKPAANGREVEEWSPFDGTTNLMRVHCAKHSAG